jgi:hypothetical protein
VIDPERIYGGGPLGWSLSRHGALEDCERKYFLNYYANKDEPEIARLKKLDNMHLWIGHIVHDACERILTERDTVPGDVELQVARVESDMRTHWLEKPETFWHTEYGQEISEWDKKKFTGLTRTCIRNFLAWDKLPEIFEAKRDGRVLTIEDLHEYNAFGAKALLRMDLAYKGEDGTVHIVDWKSGLWVGSLNQRQLCGYAAFALSVGWVKTADEIETTLAYLAVPEYKVHRVTDEDIRANSEFIFDSVTEMRSRLEDIDQNTAKAARFPMSEKVYMCRSCQFRKVCHEDWPASEALMKAKKSESAKK